MSTKNKKGRQVFADQNKYALQLVNQILGNGRPSHAKIMDVDKYVNFGIERDKTETEERGEKVKTKKDKNTNRQYDCAKFSLFSFLFL